MSVEASHGQSWLPINVLIVEDDSFQQRIVENLCVKCGYTVTSASSGEEAFKLTEETSTGGDPPWDLVLCDVQLREGGVTGVDVLLTLRERFGSNISIVMVSSNDQIDVVEQCILEGADSYMLKPLAKQQLATSRSFVERRRRMQEREAERAIDRSIVAIERSMATISRVESAASVAGRAAGDGVAKDGGGSAAGGANSNCGRATWAFDLAGELGAPELCPQLDGAIDGAIDDSAAALLDALLLHVQKRPASNLSSTSSPASSFLSTMGKDPNSSPRVPASVHGWHLRKRMSGSFRTAGSGSNVGSHPSGSAAGGSSDSESSFGQVRAAVLKSCASGCRTLWLSGG